jgi:hypothetical protein
MTAANQVEKLKQLAAETARNAAIPAPPDYRIHRIGKEIRARLKVEFPATDFFIATSDGFGTMCGEVPPMVELRWNDGPSVNALREKLQGIHSRDFDFDVVFAHGFTCRACGHAHGGTIDDRPGKCTGGGDGFGQW